jgi:hypothetical protein
MARPAVHTIRHLTDEPFFIQCADGLRDENGTQVATITSIDSISLEKRESSDPLTWSEAVGINDFDSLQVLDDPTTSFTDDMIAGRVSIGGASPVPAAGEGYAIVAHCTITFGAAYGGGTAKRDFVRPVRIAASLETAPAS